MASEKKQQLLPCGHSDLSKISHLGDREYFTCMFCDWRSDKEWKPAITLEHILSNVIFEYNQIIKIENITNIDIKDSIQDLIEYYAEELRNYSLTSFASLGGQATFKKYGKDKMREWGKKGGRPKKRKRKNYLLR